MKDNEKDDEMKKIYFITTNIINSGGTERVIANVSNSLVKYYDIEICSISSKDGLCFYKLNDKVKIEHLGLCDYEHQSSKIKKIVMRVVVFWGLYKKVKKIDDCILIGVNKNISMLLAIYSIFNRNLKVFGWEHFANNAPMSKIISFSRDVLFKRLKKLIVLTDFDFKYYKSKGVDVMTIPNAVSNFHKPIRINREKIVLSVGRHTEQKDFERLIYIWKSIVLGGCNDWRLRIIGDGPLFEKNQSVAKELGIYENIDFILPTKDISNEYFSASILAMTSAYEAFPMVLLEALSCGLPCIAFDCDTGPRDIITSGSDGFVIPYRDDQQYIDTLKSLMSNIELIKEFSEHAIYNVKRFDEDNIITRWIEILSKM